MDSLTTEYFQVVLHKFILIKSVCAIAFSFTLAIGNYMIMLVCEAFFFNGWIFDVDSQSTPFENAQRWMGKNTFHFLLLNDDNMIGEH